METIFPKKMLENSAMTPESIAETFSYIHEQSHLLHLQTLSYAEHKCLDTVYNDIVGIKDSVLEVIQGYTGKRLQAYKLRPLGNYSPGAPVALANEIISFGAALGAYGESNNMPEIKNIADGLSGLGASTKYLLSLT